MENKHKHSMPPRDVVFTSLVLGVPVVTLTLPTYLTLSHAIAPEFAIAIPIMGVIVLALTSLLAS